VAKHGGEMRSCRRWDERRLAYPIKRKRRATFLLTYCDLPATALAPLNRDLEINETVLRHLLLRAEELPSQELELTAAEDATDFVLPEPPPDDHSDEQIEAREGGGRSDDEDSDDDSSSDDDEES
jgi:small subunit ribosomal protein S6